MRKTLFGAILAGSAFLSSLFFLGGPVSFRSLESVTETGGPVFNRVRLISGWSQDIWLMQQNHSGLVAGFEKWDRLAIVVDKSRRPYQARFFQFRPGEFVLPGEPAAAPFKARCFACHSNGPRAIRANLTTSQLRVGWLGRVQVGLWNLRIKTYGRVDPLSGREIAGGAPFRSRYAVLAQPLKLKSCVLCHSETGIRKPLQLEHAGTAHFLVEKGLMPPFPLRAGSEDVELLRRLTQPVAAARGDGC